MKEKRSFILQPLPHPSRRLAIETIRDAADGMSVTIQEPTRNLEQNAKLWAMLAEVSRLDWHGNKLTTEEWKDVFTAALKRQKVVPGIDGGFVVLGARTSRMGKREFVELIELITAFGTQNGVTFKDSIEPEPYGRTA